MTNESAMTNAERAARLAAAPRSLWLLDSGQSVVQGAARLVAGVLVLAIRAYQLTFSPAQAYLFGAAGGCRYTPSCSTYAGQALREHGVLAGSALSVRRICRCHPWGGCGHDPVPAREIQPPKSEIRSSGAAI
jgi:putative membrane protein insertion efficiency factor